MLEGFTESPGSGSYQVLARRTRPQSFAELVGQEAVTSSLGTILQSGKIPHAFLFTGTRGTGKTSSARILAKSLCCVQGPTLTPCQTCHHCVQITACAHEDVLEIDAATNTGVDNIRELREAARFYPSSARFKIFIIDEVHMLSIGAFNALLKTLEEPPPQVVFILATTELHKVPVTVRSRCMTFSFRKYSSERIAAHLRALLEKEGLTYDNEALALVAREAKGSMRDSLSLLEQVIAFSGGRHVAAEKARAALSVMGEELAQKLFAALCGAHSDEALDALKEADDASLDVATLLDTTATLARHALVLKQVPDRTKAARLTSLLPSEMDALAAASATVTSVALGEFYKLLSAASRDAARSTNPLQWAEVAAIDCIARADWLTAGELLALLGGQGLAGGSPGSQGSPGNRGPSQGSTPLARGAMPQGAGSATGVPEGNVTQGEANETHAASQGGGPAPSPWASRAPGRAGPGLGGGATTSPSPGPTAPPMPLPPVSAGVDMGALQMVTARVEKQSPGLASKLRNAVFDDFNARRVAWAAVSQNSIYTDLSEGDAILLVEILSACGFGSAELAGLTLPRGVSWNPRQAPPPPSDGRATGAPESGPFGEELPPPRPRAGFLERKPAGEKKNNGVEAAPVAERAPFDAQTPTSTTATMPPSAPAQRTIPPAALQAQQHPAAQALQQMRSSQPSPAMARPPQATLQARPSPIPPAQQAQHRAGPPTPLATSQASRPTANTPVPHLAPAARPIDTPASRERVSLATHEKREREKNFEERAARLLERPELAELRARASGITVLPFDAPGAGE